MRQFLSYIQERAVQLEAVRPADVDMRFLRMRLKRSRHRLGRLPKRYRSWRSYYTAPVCRFLRTIKTCWPPPIPAANARERFHREVLEDYGRWLIELHGLSKWTLDKNSRVARRLLDWLDERADRHSLGLLCTVDIDEYLSWRLPNLRRATRQGECQCLRSFLRYLHGANLLPGDLSHVVSGPTIYKDEEIPRAFTEQQIGTLLAVTRRDRSPKGLRDYAILLMLATYGVRAAELAGLRLENIDWRAGCFRVRRSKTGKESFLPLVPPVGQALLNYLKRGRPKTDCREVFLRIRAPLKPFGRASALNDIILARMAEAGVEVQGRHGTHAFRFARALSLLRGAVPPKLIADLLGHTTTASTQVYLKLQTDDLRAISLDLPGKKPNAELPE